jgi:hypothetical protein
MRYLAVAETAIPGGCPVVMVEGLQVQPLRRRRGRLRRCPASKHKVVAALSMRTKAQVSPVAVSSIRTVRSLPAMASQVPSGANNFLSSPQIRG